MPADRQFRRVLGPWSAGALVTGSMTGTGIFYFVAPVAERLPSRTGILSAWLAGALIAFAGALCLAALEDRRNALATLAILLSGSLAYTVQRRGAGCLG